MDFYLQKDLDIAVCHYWFMSWRGGEKVVENILKIFPKADIYTLFCSKQIKKTKLKKHRVKVSCFNFLAKFYQELFPLYPFAVRSLRMDKKYDLIISSESGPIKGINKGNLNKNTPHICYIHTPMRYCWGFANHYLNKGLVVNKLISFFLYRLRKWDLKTVSNVDYYLSNSKNVKNRVKKYYNRDSKVIYPPIETNYFERLGVSNQKKKDIYLSFGAITPYKKVDLLVDTFLELKDKKLVIIGEGKELEKLQKKIKNTKNHNIKLLGRVPYVELGKYLSSTRAFLFPGEEDFGMTPLEMMSFGIPVIAFGKGGALETVVKNNNYEKATGIFFKKQTKKDLKEAIFKFEEKENLFNSDFIRSWAKKFDESIFRNNMRNIIKSILKI